MNREAMFSSKTDDWATPIDLFTTLDNEFHFTLDPCASAENHKCEKFFTKEQNGLAQDWSNDVVLCNPPYGRQIGKWVEKAYETSKLGGTVVMLIPARTDTKWFHEYILGKAQIMFVRGRIKFGNAKYNAPFPCMIVVYR